MKKGVVMDIDESFLTLLTPDGEFLRARRQEQQYTIGEEIHFFPITNDSPSRLQKSRFLFKRKPVWALSIMAALLVFLGSLLPLYQDNKAYAYMSIDVKPSIELGVNKKMQVVELAGYNKEGKKIISTISNWRKKEVSQVTEAILAEMQKEGYLKTNGSVIISTVCTKDSDKEAEFMLNQNIKEIKANAVKDQLNLKVFNGTEQEREKAHKLGITTGKYYETQIEPSITAPKNVAPVVKEQKDIIPTQPVNIPPGQQKKQLEVSQPQQNSKQSINIQAASHQAVGKPVSPGQLKKLNGDQTKQNIGQVKKKLISKNNSPQSKKAPDNKIALHKIKHCK